MFRPIAVLLGILLLTNTPAYAGPVKIGDVFQLVGNYQNPPSLRLQGVWQTSSTPVASTTASSPLNSIDGSAVSLGPNSLLAGITFDQDPQKTVSVVTQGDVEVAVCDCGFVTVGGGFPKWPLLFLAAVPLFFIDRDKDDEIIPNPTPTPNPNPTPPQTPVPEPASLLLFGSGLAAVGASLRRRRMMAKLKMQSETTEEG